MFTLGAEILPYHDFPLDVALRELVALKRFKALMKKNEGKLSFANLDE